MRRTSIAFFVCLSFLVSGVARADESDAVKACIAKLVAICSKDCATSRCVSNCTTQAHDECVRNTTTAQLRSTTKADPYRNYRFRISFGAAYVAGFSEFRQIATASAAAPGAASSVSASAHGGSGVPVQVPGSLVGRPGTVTLICSVAPNNTIANTGPGNVALLCAFPVNNGVAGSVVTKSPGESKFDAITLERGITHDASFESWASSVGAGSRRDLVVDLFNEAGLRTGGYQLRGCLVVTFQGLPLLDDAAKAVSIAALKFHCDSVTNH